LNHKGHKGKKISRESTRITRIRIVAFLFSLIRVFSRVFAAKFFLCALSVLCGEILAFSDGPIFQPHPFFNARGKDGAFDVSIG
jgi:uncharacterized membrane protein